MLIQEREVLKGDPILSLVAAVNGNKAMAKELRQGVYEVGHFGGSHFLRGYDQYPDLSVGPYGVCDSLENLLEKCPELEAQGRYFVVTLTKVRREDQPESGGWRWHKWGEYIGTQAPMHEYLYDDKHIDEVLVFHIYERT